MGYNHYRYARKVGANVEINDPTLATAKITLVPNANIVLTSGSGTLAQYYSGVSEKYAITFNATDLALGIKQTNTNLFLLPNGTGKVKFGAYTATPATDSTGFIDVLDAAGNARKLMIQA
jgi:hypothetical protein